METGQETLASIEQALAEVSADVQRLTAELDSANQEKARLIAERLEGFRELARLRASLAVVDGVIDETDQLSGQVRSILDARQRTLTALQQREAASNRERERLIAEQAELDRQVAELEKKLDDLGEQARKALASEKAYSETAKRHQEYLGVVEKAAEKAEKSRAEEAEKGAPYRNDVLFMYLWERGYGTSDYNATGLIRWLDDWVAGLIKYQDVRGNFAMLTAIPERLNQHVERLKQAMAAEKAALDAFEAAKIRELAGDDLPNTLHQVHDRRDKQATAVAALNAELLETGNQLKSYAEGQDPSFREAIDNTAKFLAGQNLETLVRDARQTPDIRDDEIGALIGKLAEEVATVERLENTKREALDAAFARKQELLRIAADFRRARYDHPDSVFTLPSGRQQLLALLLQGAITAAEYWMRTQRGQHWRDRPADSYRRSSNFPSGGRDGGADYDRGGDFRTGGGF
jgi:DNA repair exonuclease SbcCD ATPase subunit